MDITFSCSKCGQHIAIDETGAGQLVDCPQCGISLEVPYKSEAATSRRAYPPPQTNLINCRDCGLEISKRAASCPHCGAPAASAAPPPQRYYKTPPPKVETVSTRSIVGYYFLAILMPLFGFFAGIYLMAKKETGHGVACMALSVACFLFWLQVIK